MRLVTPLEMMKLEEQTNQAGISYLQMMESAGKGLAEHIARIALQEKITEVMFLCGNGNNGGDCYAAAALLSRKLKITICLVNGMPKTRTAYSQFKKMKQVTVESDPEKILQLAADHKMIVDGIFGIGFRGELSSQIKQLFDVINADPNKICVAVDIPSGGNGLTGSASDSVLRCTATITFGAAKMGLFLPPLSEKCGAIFLAKIGIPEAAFGELTYPVKHISSDSVKEMLPPRPLNAHKGMFGKLLTIAGSRNMPGAAILASQAALRCGVGLYTLASEPDVCRLLISHNPEAMILPLNGDYNGMLTQQAVPAILEAAKTATCVLMGCGLGQSDALREMITALIPQIECPMVLDADALNVICNRLDVLNRAKSTIILTPHPGEMSRLLHCSTEEIQMDRVSAAKRFVIRYPKTILVLKGAGTIVASSERASINTNGNSGMSKGGSGDVLAGIIASLTAQHIEPNAAAQIGVYVHGLAGDCAAAEFSKRSMLPSDIINQIPLVFANLE